MRLFTFERRVVVQQLFDRCFWRVGEGCGSLAKAQATSLGGRAHNPLPLSVVDRGGWREVRARVWRR